MILVIPPKERIVLSIGFTVTWRFHV